MAFFCDETDLQIDDNLFEFWGAFCDPHELDDAFAATTTSNAFSTTTSSSATFNNVSVSSTNSSESSLEASVKLSAAPPIMHCQANNANGAHLSTQPHDNIRTELSSTPSTSITDSSTTADDSTNPATVSDDDTSNAQPVSEFLISQAIYCLYTTQCCLQTFSRVSNKTFFLIILKEGSFLIVLF